MPTRHRDRRVLRGVCVLTPEAIVREYVPGPVAEYALGCVRFDRVLRIEDDEGLCDALAMLTTAGYVIAYVEAPTHPLDYVILHEVAHVVAGHCALPVGSPVTEAERELEADGLARQWLDSYCTP